MAPARGATQLAPVKADLRERFRKSAYPAHDWPLREQAEAILTKMSPRELEEFAREWLPPGSAPNPRLFRRLEDPLFREVLRQWVAKDPESACQSLAGTHMGALPQVFGQWLDADPVSARAWLTRTNLPLDEEEIRTTLNRSALAQLAVEDFSTARQSLSGLDLESQKQTLEEWSIQLAHSPDKRAELLALVAARGDDELTEKCHRALVEEMAEKSPNEAAIFIETTHLTEDQKNKLNDHVIGSWAMREPVQAFAKWAELGREDAPPEMLEAISEWGLNPPGRKLAVEWIKNLPSGPVRDQFTQRFIGTNDYVQDAELSDSLSDPIKRISNLKNVKLRWESHSPNDAEAWFQKLPQADKEALEKSP